MDTHPLPGCLWNLSNPIVLKCLVMIFDIFEKLSEEVLGSDACFLSVCNSSFPFELKFAEVIHYIYKLVSGIVQSQCWL